ncbi:MAG: hypothetical protein ABW279_08280 [Acidimicrobiales bacterium]
MTDAQGHDERGSARPAQGPVSRAYAVAMLVLAAIELFHAISHVRRSIRELARSVPLAQTLRAPRDPAEPGTAPPTAT